MTAAEATQADSASDDLRLWSVTTILGVLDRPALVSWAVEQTAREAVRVAGTLASRVAEDGEDAVVSWLCGARWRRPKGQISDTEFGSRVHQLVEEYALTGVKPAPSREQFGAEVDVAQACIDRFDEWAQRFQPEYLAAELSVYNLTYGYAGTADAFARVGGVPLIVDYKATRRSWDREGRPARVYPETALQLAAYRHAELAAVWRARKFERFKRRYYLLSADEQARAVPVPATEGGIAVKITPEHCTAYPVRCDALVLDAFLYTLECARWQFELSRHVIGDPLRIGEEVT